MSSLNDWGSALSRLYGPIALVAPAVRMVVVAAGKDTDDGAEPSSWHFIYPVVAIRSTVMYAYRQSYRLGQPPPATYATHKELVDNGWVYAGLESGPEEDIIVVSERGMLPVNDAVAGNEDWRAVACTWPREEDEVRLAPIVAELLEAIPGPK